MIKDTTEFKGGRHVIVTLDKHETFPAMVSTKRQYVGPGKVSYTEYDDGATIVHSDECTARTQYKAGVHA